MEEQEETQEQLTPEQIKQRREEMLSFFKEQIPFLEVQQQYETHLTEIEELRTRRIRAQVMLGQMLAPPPGEKQDKPKVESKTE